MNSSIGTAEFKKRLALLCLKGGGRGFPRKQRDQYILFKSIILILEPGRDYTEAELNEGLVAWLLQVGRNLEVDYVSLRRYLVDTGFIVRDPAGRCYRVNRDPSVDLFEAGIEQIDPVGVLEEAGREAGEGDGDT